LFVEKFHVGEFYELIFIHPVDAHALASSGQHPLAQGENLGFLPDGEGRAVALIKVRGPSVQENGDFLVLVQKEVAEPDRVPFDFRVLAGEDDQYLHNQSSLSVLIVISYDTLAALGFPENTFEGRM
jgi:hypothetical protein